MYGHMSKNLDTLNSRGMAWGRNDFYPTNSLPRSIDCIDLWSLYFDEGLNQAFKSWTIALTENILSAYIKMLRQKTRAVLPAENLKGQMLQWLAPYISDGSMISLPRSLYVPLIIGPSREFVRIWLRTRQPEKMQEAREPLAKAAWYVIAAPVS